MSKVSIIIPVHNTASYLDKCFSSIVDQTLSDIEIIAVDDGSTDGSWQEILKWMERDHRFSKSFQIQHQGLSCARNMGLDRAAGEFVAFVDSDDFMETRYCELPYLLGTQSSADVVIFGSCWESPGGQEICLPHMKNGLDLRQVIAFATASVWDKLFRRSFLNGFGLRFVNLYHEDLYATPQILVRSPRVAVLDVPLYHYVRRENSICGLKINPRSADQLEIFSLLMGLCEDYPAFGDEVRYRAIGHLRAMMTQWAQCGEPWALECQDRAQALLLPYAQVERTNKYLNPPVWIGKRLERRLRNPLRKVRKALGLC